MTKRVRIENADNSDYVLVVQEMENGAVVRTTELKFPTDMAEVVLWQGKQILISEK